MNRVQLSKLLLAAGCAAFAAASIHSGAFAQDAAAPPPPPQFKNLQVLPKDLTREQMGPIMKSFAQSLGVRCAHCHVGEEGKPLSTFDFASDAKRAKQTARAMLRMVHKINAEDFGVKDFKDVKVTCFTCHRGAAKPLTAAPPPPPEAPAAS